MSEILIPGRETVNLPPEYLRMIAVLAETSSEVDLGLHCSRCHENVVGRNGSGDRRWIMECGCRTFVGKNPIVSH